LRDYDEAAGSILRRPGYNESAVVDVQDRPSEVGQANQLLGAGDRGQARYFEMSCQAVPEVVPLLRHRLAAFAVGHGVTGSQLDAVRLAVSEAVTNVVRHAYRGRLGGIRLTAAALDGELSVLVADDGCGYETRSANPGLGLGLAIIAAAADDLVISKRAGGGTEIQMRFLVTNAPRLPDAIRQAAADAAKVPV
jgi:serine/threonine-protein kinase RsbW